MFPKRISLRFVERQSNEDGGTYQQAIGVLYALAYTLKMSYKTDYKIEGFLNMSFLRLRVLAAGTC